MKKTTLTSILLVLLIGILSAQNFERHHAKDGHKMQRRNNYCMQDDDHNFNRNHNLMMDENLNLNSKQKEALMKIRLDNKKVSIGIRADIDKLRIDKREALYNQDFKTAKKVVKEINNLRTELEINRIEMKKKCMELLTPEQKEEMKKNEMMRPKAPNRRKRHF